MSKLTELKDELAYTERSWIWTCSRASAEGKDVEPPVRQFVLEKIRRLKAEIAQMPEVTR